MTDADNTLVVSMIEILSDEQIRVTLFEIAINSGAIVSKIVKKIRLQNPQQRLYQVRQTLHPNGRLLQMLVND